MPYKIAVVGSAFEDKHVQKIRRTAASCDCEVSFFRSHGEALTQLGDTHIIFGPSDAQSPDAARSAPNLKWFASFYAGVDPLLKNNVLGEDVILTNGSGAYGVTIAEHLVMVTLMLMRRNMEYQQLVARKEFRNDLKIHSIYDSTIVICGTGDIGSKFARRLRPFSPAKIIGVNRTGRAADAFDEVVPISEIDSVLPQADVLALALPGTPLTNNLISRERLALLKPSAYLINVGRGNCLDQDALVQALNEEKLAGAALDVFRTEPIPQDDPVWNTPNLLVTPHCSGQMTLAYTRDTLVDLFCENLQRFCSGQPLLHVVDKAQAY